MTTTKQYLSNILKELEWATSLICEEDADKLLKAILNAKKVLVAGAGRTGFMGKSFCMRMMHMGIDAYVTGETVTANFEKDDVLIVGSGSGETKSLVSMAEKARSIGGTVVAITINPESTIGKLANFAIKIPGASKDRSGLNEAYQTIQPMGSLFEQTLLMFYDAMILRFMDEKLLDSGKMYGRHANLE